MGVHTYIYLGPYVECTHRKMTRTVTMRACTKKECAAHPNKLGKSITGNFCPVCGLQLGDVKFEVPEFISPYDVVDDELAPLSSDDGEGEGGRTFCLCPNDRREGDPADRRGRMTDNEEFALDLRTVDMKAEMDWLSKAFAPELVKLRENYAKVEVKWGLHQYVR